MKCANEHLKLHMHANKKSNENNMIVIFVYRSAKWKVCQIQKIGVACLQ